MSDRPMIPKNYKMLKQAKRLRREMTRHEKHIWYDFLQQYPLKIYKQRIIGNYIADFYCATAKLVIEIDGSQHRTESGTKEDAVRDAYMSSLGLKVLRISNEDIDNCFHEVCEYIDCIIRERITVED